jgi:hypothetical protein
MDAEALGASSDRDLCGDTAAILARAALLPEPPGAADVPRLRMDYARSANGGGEGSDCLVQEVACLQVLETKLRLEEVVAHYRRLVPDLIFERPSIGVPVSDSDSDERNVRAYLRFDSRGEWTPGGQLSPDATIQVSEVDDEDMRYSIIGIAAGREQHRTTLVIVYDFRVVP